MNNQGELILTGLFESEVRSKEFLKVCLDTFKDLKYCYSTLDGILATNKADKLHMELSHRANSLILSMEIIKKAVKNHFKEQYQSKEVREMKFRSLDKDMDMNLEYILRVSRGLSYESGLIVYDKCRKFNTARINGLKRINPSSSEYLDLIIRVLGEFKYRNYDI